MLGRRQLAIVAVAGALAAIVALVGGVWFAAALDDEPSYDGEFVLDEPGVYAPPAGGSNADVSGRALPDVALVATDGATATFADYRGAPLVVNVWFSYCPPCQRELADFATVHGEVGDRIQFVGVDPFDSVEVMEKFASERGVTYDLLRDPDQELPVALEIVTYPATFFVDADGRVLHQAGELDADELRHHIELHWPTAGADADHAGHG